MLLYGANNLKVDYIPLAIFESDWTLSIAVIQDKIIEAQLDKK